MACCAGQEDAMFRAYVLKDDSSLCSVKLVIRFDVIVTLILNYKHFVLL